MAVNSLNEAFSKANLLPAEDQELIGRELSDYIDDLRALREQVLAGIRSLDAGLGRELDLEAFLARVRAGDGGS